MMQSRKVCVFTGTRAEYGLLLPLIKRLDSADDFELQLLVSGSHLSPEFGLTYHEIEADGFTIDAKCEMLLSADSPSSVPVSTGLGMMQYAKEIERLQPDFIILLGDRFEALAMATAAMLVKCPIVHFHGGETTEGAIDESIRHAITKMSHLHFTSTEKYRKRVMQLGEQPEQVLHVGAIGLDNILELSLLDRDAFSKSIDFQLHAKNILITFHPETLAESPAAVQFQELLNAVDSLSDVGVIFTMPNCDAGSRGLIEMVNNFCETRANCTAYTSLGQSRYLSALQHVDAVVGNSSSGIIEAPSFNVATVNIGNRQRGRESGGTVIHCCTEEKVISAAIDKAISISFKEEIATLSNVYGNGGVTDQVMEVLRSIDLQSLLIKRFYDLDE